MTTKKLQRALEFEEKDGKLYFKMERHQAALGTVYTPGAGMSAYTTRVETYEYDPSSETIEVVECSEPTLDWDSVDCWGVAESSTFDFSYTFEYDETKKAYFFSESCCNFEAYVSSLDEALKSVSKEVESMCFDADCYPEIAGLPESQQLEFEKECIKAHKEIMPKMVREAWEDREDDDWKTATTPLDQSS